MTLQLPGPPDDDRARQDKFDTIAQAIPGFGGASAEVRCGVGSTTFTGASAVTTPVVITHGLGRAPAVVICTFKYFGTGVTNFAVSSLTATTFTATGVDNDGIVRPAAWGAQFYWIAIG